MLTFYSYHEWIRHLIRIRINCCIRNSCSTNCESVPRVVTRCQRKQTRVVTCRRWCPRNDGCRYTIVRWLGYICRCAWNDWNLVIWKTVSCRNQINTTNDNDMLSYSLTTMMCFLTKEYGFPAYTVNLFIKAYQKITYKEDLKIT